MKVGFDGVPAVQNGKTNGMVFSPENNNEEYVLNRLITVDLGKDSYEIVLEKGALDKAGTVFDLNRKVLVVTDDGVPAAYAETIMSQSKDAQLITLPAGESAKSFENLKRILSEMLQASFTRKDCVVAVGGGVVGDLSGFAAAYMRG